MALPKDPIILMSYLNTQLRDKYPSLDALCEDMNENAEEIAEKLKKVGYEYDSERNCFR